MLRRVLLGLLVLMGLGFLGLYGLGKGWFGRHQGPGEVSERSIPPDVVAARGATQSATARKLESTSDKQILFGDLHVHTTFSPDAYMMSLPMLQGEGTHPPADACDFARFCSSLDFWSINDHAEGITPAHWRETVSTIRQCNQVAGEGADPDVVAFLGWEWTQVGNTPEDHYGHKNVVLRDLEEEHIPVRPIASRGMTARALQPLPWMSRALLAATGGDRSYVDAATYLSEIETATPCPEGRALRDLPPDCVESAATPGELFAKLDEWGHEAMVIPHGTTWGFYTPPGSTWDKQLTRAQHDPDRQTLVEVFSGHGNSEEYRGFEAVTFDAEGKPQCPAPTRNYLPTCWRAGEIIRGRCQAEKLPAATCEERAAEARANFVAAGLMGPLTVPGATALDWLDAGQCRDCFLPAFNYRPGSSVQYMMALTNFDDPEDPLRFRFGFIASSDNHTARPGTGYKEYARQLMTEAAGPVDDEWRSRLAPKPLDPVASSRAIGDLRDVPVFQRLETERQASFFLTGGLVAVHAAGRGRGAIWDALDRREVYATSGERILLWFDLLNPPAPAGAATDPSIAPPAAPMGSEVSLDVPPRFRVRAAGSFEQLPGCPDWSTEALGPERLENLCRGECYHPSDRRKRITRIEVVRIRPQTRPGEPVESLIDDPFLVLPCPASADGCTAEFEDPDFPAAGRDALYYVRAIQEPSLAVNAANLRCERGEDGECTRIDPCHGDFRTPFEEDCLAPAEERAWSSPIFVDWRRRTGASPLEKPPLPDLVPLADGPGGAQGAEQPS
jgi:hypothetical protein